MPLADRPCWIFDMDGTLTVPVHDFAWLHARLGIPRDVDILTALSERSEERRAADLAVIAAWEAEAASRAQAQDDALALLAALEGRTLGVLTRNTRDTALRTLEATGLARFFHPDDVVTRDCAPPKPHPGGVERLLARWSARGADAVVVGDWVYDAQAGRAAGAATVLVLRHGPQPWDAEADWLVPTLWEVVEAVRTGGTNTSN